MLFSSYNMLKEQITFSMLPKKKKQNRHQLNEKPKCYFNNPEGKQLYYTSILHKHKNIKWILRPNVHTL